VVNTPLPVTLQGTGAISGTVAATQSGTWNVGITNAALPVANTDDPSRMPYQSSLQPDCSDIVCAFAFGKVPDGKRLVVQQCAGGFDFTGPVTATSPASACVFAENTGLTDFPVVCFNVGTVGSHNADFDQPVQLYFDAGQSVTVQGGPGGLSNTF